jgi:hypothetical protein
MTMINTTSSYHPFQLNKKQDATFESNWWMWDGEKVDFSIGIDGGPRMNFIYRVKHGVIEPIRARDYGPCFVSMLTGEVSFL